jgi:hypothetical protein
MADDENRFENDSESLVIKLEQLVQLAQLAQPACPPNLKDATYADTTFWIPQYMRYIPFAMEQPAIK